MGNYLVVGASSGIGKALAIQLLEQGHSVYGTYKNHEIDSSEIHAHFLDVQADELDFDFLPEALDGIAFCPGSINLQAFSRIKPKAFLEDFDLQVVSAVKVLQAVTSRLKKSKSASVVLFSTVAVQTGFSFHAQVAASKGAIEGLTRALAAEWAPRIRVNAIAPSLTDTPLAAKLLSSEEKRSANDERHPLKRIGTAKDIASAAAFLLSSNAAWVTGQILKVDGGMSGIR